MFSVQTKITKKLSGKKYVSYYVPLPKKVFLDSQFPFKYGDKIQICIDADNNQVIINKIGIAEEIELEKPNREECKQKEQTTMIEKKKSTPKKSQNNQTQMIICPECRGKNVVSQTSIGRKCTHCGFNIKKENYEFVLE